MIERSLVHIGYHKTATNWFQRRYYPAVTNYRYVQRKRVRAAFLEDHAFEFDSDRALSRLEVSSPNGLILCEEELSGNLHNGGLYGFLSKEVAHRLKAVLPQAEIIIFIRSQPEMICSVYKQYVKEGGTHSPRRYLYPFEHLDERGFSPKKTPYFAFQHFNYRLLINHYREVFGPQRVHVFLYEEFAQEQAAFMQRFAARFSLAAAAVSPSERLNVSNKALSLQVSRWMNRFAYRNVMDKRYIVNIPGMHRLRLRLAAPLLDRIAFWSGPTNAQKILGNDIIRDIEERYRECNRLLAQELDLPLQRYRYPL